MEAQNLRSLLGVSQSALGKPYGLQRKQLKGDQTPQGVKREACLVIRMPPFAVFIKLLIHFLEHLAHIVGEPHDGWIPVRNIVFQRSEYERQDGLAVLSHQAHNVLVVPQEQRPLCNLHAKPAMIDCSSAFIYVSNSQWDQNTLQRRPLAESCLSGNMSFPNV